MTIQERIEGFKLQFEPAEGGSGDCGDVALEGNLEKLVKIGNELSAKEELLIGCLARNQDAFSSSYLNMKGIDPKIICHRLNIDPSAKLVKQKKLLCSINRAKIINEEAEQLLPVGSIKLVSIF